MALGCLWLWSPQTSHVNEWTFLSPSTEYKNSTPVSHVTLFIPFVSLLDQSKHDKWRAVVEEAYKTYLQERPVLIGTSRSSNCTSVLSFSGPLEFSNHQFPHFPLFCPSSVSDSQELSEIMKGIIPHAVLNAKPEVLVFVLFYQLYRVVLAECTFCTFQNAAREAELVAQAGRKAMVTISTNMAGRGTDILLGGNPEVHLQNLSRSHFPPYKI